MQERYYSPSGRYGKMAIPMFLAATLLILPILGYLYSFISGFIPFIFLKFFATLGYFYVAYLVLQFCVKKGKIRSTKFYLIFATIALLSGYYIHWVAFFSSSIAESIEGINIATLAMNPLSVKSLIGLYSDIGITLSKNGSSGKTWNGGVLYFIWFVEFVIMFFLPLLSGVVGVDAPYSELNDDWFTENKLSKTLEINQSEEEIKAELEKHNYSILENANLSDPDFDVFYRVSLFDSAGEDDYMTLKKITVTYAKGERKESESDIVENLRIPNYLTEKLKSKLA